MKKILYFFITAAVILTVVSVCVSAQYSTEKEEDVAGQVNEIQAIPAAPETEPEKAIYTPELEEQRKQNYERITANTIDYRIPGSDPDKKPEAIDVEGNPLLRRIPKEIFLYINEIPPVEVGEDGSLSLYGIQLEAFYAQGMGISLFLEGKIPSIACLATLLNVEDEQKALEVWNACDEVESACLHIGCRQNTKK